MQIFKYLPTTTSSMNVADLIQNAGLTKGEAKVYISLVKIGMSTTGPIVEHSKVARSFIYIILQKLMEKGLVSQIMKEQTQYYQATEPQRLIDLIEKQQVTLSEKKEQLQKLLPSLMALHSEKPNSIATIYSGYKGVQTCFEKHEKILKSGEEYVTFGVLADQTDTYHTYWKKHHLNRIKKNIKCRMLFNTDTDKLILKNRNSYIGCESRYMPIDTRTPAWIMVYSDICAIFLQSPAQFVIEIQNKEIAQTMQSYFEYFWSLSIKI